MVDILDFDGTPLEELLEQEIPKKDIIPDKDRLTCPKTYLYIHNNLLTKCLGNGKIRALSTWINFYLMSKRSKTLIVSRENFQENLSKIAKELGICKRTFYYHLEYLKKSGLLHVTKTDTHVIWRLASKKELNELYGTKMTVFIDTAKLKVNTNREVTNYLEIIPALTYLKRMKRGIIDYRYFISIKKLIREGKNIRLNRKGKKIFKTLENNGPIPKYKIEQLPTLSNVSLGSIMSTGREKARMLFKWAQDRDIVVAYKRMAKYGYGDELSIIEDIKSGAVPKHAFLGLNNEIVAQDSSCYFTTHDKWFLREKSIYFLTVVTPAINKNTDVLCNNLLLNKIT